MSDLKMSDVFRIPLHKREYFVESDPYIPLGSSSELIDTIECCTAQEAYAVAHAINSHDKLVSDLAESQAEVERLREAMRSLIEYKGILTSDNESFIHAKKLLSKDGE